MAMISLSLHVMVIAARRHYEKAQPEDAAAVQ